MTKFNLITRITKEGIETLKRDIKNERVRKLLCPICFNSLTTKVDFAQGVHEKHTKETIEQLKAYREVN